MSEKRKRSPERSEHNVIFRSAPIEDRSSKFIGYFSPSLKPKELQAVQEFSSADHKIAASRRESNQQAITGGIKYTTDHDDDGEKYAGKRIAKVLDGMQVVGACVVARWYGGVLLGPVRFEHIDQCAKEAVQKWRDSEAEAQSKRQKVEEEAAEHERLVDVLAERDKSIIVLRALALEKEEKLRVAKEAGEEKSQEVDAEERASSPVLVQSQISDKKPALEYADLSLPRLRAFEKARDATLAFLLKRIDKAELELVGATGELPAT